MTNHLRYLWLALPSLILASGSLEAATLGSAMKLTAKALAGSADEATQCLSRSIGRLADSGDEALQRLGRELTRDADDAAGAARSLDALRKLEHSAEASGLARELGELSPAGRRTLAGILEQSRRIVEAGIRRGIGPDQVARSLERGGPEALLTLRAMRSDEGIEAGLDGFRRYGGRFAEFARKGDEGAVRWLAEHADGLEPRQIDELLTNPARYIDAEGRLTRAGEDLVRVGGRKGLRNGQANGGRAPEKWGRRGIVVAALGGLLILPDRVVDFVQAALGRAVADLLRPVRWPLVVIILAAAGWFLLPRVRVVLGRPARRIATYALSRLPEKTRAVAARLGRPALGPLVPEPPNAPGGRLPAVLRLGFLGSRRVGKSTFIAMMNKKLPVLVDGASFEPLAERPDREVLDEIVDEVSRCRPTRDEKRLRFRLVWPYRPGGAGDARGKSDNEVILTDFPGEWAAEGASPGDRRKLVEYLNQVDGLFVVIDPSELEADGDRDRADAQRKVIDGMFREDGLDLGRRFLRSMAFVVTKRDQLDRPTLERLAGVPDGPGPGGLDRMSELAARPALTAAESSELGRWVLDAMFPGHRRKWENQLESARRGIDARPWWRRLLARSADPQFSVFVVSLLGPDLGRLVLEHRRAIARWQDGGRPGPEPAVALDFGRADTKTLDFHLPFRWMFDHLPGGLLHQANAMPGLAGHGYRRSTHRRFPGAPAVIADRKVGWRRFGVAVAALLIAAISVQPLLEGLQAGQERSIVRDAFAGAANGDLDPATLRDKLTECRQLSTRPYVDELNQFEIMLRNRPELVTLKSRLDDGNLPAADRLMGGVDWLNAYARLPKKDEMWPSKLKDYRQKFDHELREVLGKSVDLCLAQARAGQDGAEVHIRGVRGAIPGEAAVPDRDVAAALPVARRKLDDKLAEIRADEAMGRFGVLLGEIEKLVGGAMPEFAPALQKLNTFDASEADSPKDLRAKVRGERDRLMNQFWRHTKARSDDAADRDDFEAISNLLVQFERVPDQDEDRRALLRDYRQGLDRRRVEAKIKAAKAALPRDPERAIASLNDARAYLPRLRARSPEVVRRWYEMGVEARRAQGRWGDAVQVLRDPDVASESWVKGLCTDLWARWAEQLQESVPRSSLEEAKEGISRFLNLAGPDTPAGLVAAVQKLNDGLAPRRMQDELQKADKLSEIDPSKALDALLALRADVPKIQETAGLVRWREAVVANYRRLGRHPEAVLFIAGLENLPPVPPEMIAEIWGSYATYRKEKFRDLVTKQQPEEAWRSLWGACRETRASDAYAADLRGFAGEQISRRLGELKEKVADSVRDQQYEQATRLVGEARKELGEWTADRRYDGELALRESEIRHAEVAREVGSLDSAITRAGSTEPLKQAERRIASLLARPELDDRDRAGLTGLRVRCLSRWEGLAYTELRRVASELNFAAMGTRAEAYLDPSSPFGEKRPPDRQRAVQALKRWLEEFDQPKEYVITAVRVKDLPYPSSAENEWGGGYDPFVAVTVSGGQDPITITTGTSNKGGSFAFIRFDTNTRFTWHKGQPIELDIWDDGVEAPGRCMGRVRGADPYALLQLALPGRDVGVNPELYDYRDYAGFKQLRLGLDVSGLDPAPSLPR